jgi:predicted TIM-barrel fold metal-dependent hydrolase
MAGRCLPRHAEHLATRLITSGTLSEAFWVDAIAYAPVPLRAALDTFDTDRMVYGSDYPFAALLSPHELAAIDPAALELVATNGKVLLKETTVQRI